MTCFSWKNLTCPTACCSQSTPGSEAEVPSPGLPLPATESALSGSWLFHLLWYYLSKYSTREDNQASTFFKNVFINLLTNHYVETKWIISAIKSRLNPLLNIELSSYCFELFWKHNYQNVYTVLTNLFFTTTQMM